MIRHMRTGLVAASLLALSSGAAFADYQLNILHINDLHSRIEPINKYDSTCSAEEEEENECFGGVARVKSAIDAHRKNFADAGANVLVLDAGDQFQGSLFYTTYKSEAVAEFMNGIGFDAMAVGNHEFDDGPEELAKFLDKVKFPVISGNTVIGADTPIANRIPGYIVKEVGGQKIAVVSVLATDTDETSSPGKSVFFEDEITYLKGIVPKIEAEGINKIILLSHVGYRRDKEIAAAVDGIDVIVGGHSHTLLSNTDEKAAGPYPTNVKNPSGVEVPIVQAYAYSKYLGNLMVVFDDQGKVKSASGKPELLDASITPDAGFKDRIAELGKPIEELKTKEISEATAVIDGSRETCRAQECAMGNLVADAMLARVAPQGISVAIQNGGGLRASIDEGTVTMGEVLTVLPFQNTVATFQLKGSDLIAALENGLSQIEEGAGRFPQVAGLKYSFDKSKPAGNRVVSVEVKEGDGFVPLDPTKTYGVVSNNYMRAGGDGYEIFATAGMNAYDFGPSLEEVVADYLAAKRPYKPYTDGRITAVAAAAAAPAAEPAAAAAEAMPESTAPAGGPQKHVVASGDTLWDLAESFYGNGAEWRKISAANGDPAPRRLAIGRELEIPAK
ncbi:bifunctional metallophosphatase/5'-nucleotidase [Ensifer sp. LCM 4579]|uniref:bifunctional metallophosphatase/5'-nucleotidase n=1 Tax=Ensifer sp. LCM 4579 TaxID=1848292 RepID=UPI0008DAE26F|nr:bifunctional metallophosphatase/5'-nucleotidase [Ensifer sp. LCM 4579]OHV75453.1 multifunctional 2',3'-cyclic-nucleotide 2'-phosphodiesterase/5'-nucleotidase/3'-nucleotidase [Ensifer sp. LCM 4579]